MEGHCRLGTVWRLLRQPSRGRAPAQYPPIQSGAPDSYTQAERLNLTTRKGTTLCKRDHSATQPSRACSPSAWRCRHSPPSKPRRHRHARQGQGRERRSSKRPYSPYADRKFPTRPFFGDTHLHTGFSMDAGAFGCRLTPRDAYRFARGEQIMASSGQPAKLSRPLDFLVVADHSDNMGFFPDLFAGKPEILADPMGRKWYDMIQAGKGAEAALEIIGNFSQGTFPEGADVCPRHARPIAARGRRPSPPPSTTTNRAASPPSSATSGPRSDKGNNLHRNVIFRDNADRASQVEPFTCYPPLGSINPIDLWKWMDAYEKKTGGSVLAIAHNGNLSNGDDVPHRRGVRQSDRPRVCRAAREVGAALRGHADEGRRRGASLPLAERRVRRLRDCGTKATSTAAWRRRRRCSNSNTPARR